MSIMNQYLVVVQNPKAGVSYEVAEAGTVLKIILKRGREVDGNIKAKLDVEACWKPVQVFSTTPAEETTTSYQETTTSCAHVDGMMSKQYIPNKWIETSSGRKKHLRPYSSKKWASKSAVDKSPVIKVDFSQSADSSIDVESVIFSGMMNMYMIRVEVIEESGETTNIVRVIQVCAHLFIVVLFDRE